MVKKSFIRLCSGSNSPEIKKVPKVFFGAAQIQQKIKNLQNCKIVKLSNELFMSCSTKPVVEKCCNKRHRLNKLLTLGST
jgi:hypothetical protein